MVVASPLVIVGIPSYGVVTSDWVMARQRMSLPLGASVYDLWLTGPEDIAWKRNELCRHAIERGAKYLFMLGDDNMVPGDTIVKFMQKMIFSHAPNTPTGPISLISAVYFSRTLPPTPMMWRNWMEGAYYDWHVGEFFEMTWAGCDTLMIDVDALRNVPAPWFSLDYIFDPNQPSPASFNTEDIYFYEKMRKHGYKLWIDSSAQAIHQDRNSKVMFYLPGDWPQNQPASEFKTRDASYLVADVGCGYQSPYTHGTLVRIDGDEAVNPDIRCDLHSIPEPDCKYDEVWSRHVIEHFPGNEAAMMVQEWSRILKVGGKFVVECPNLEKAMKDILAGPPVTSEYNWWQLYGAQATPYDFHKNGFLARTLKGLLETAWGDTPIHGDPDDGVGIFADITVEVTGANGENLRAVATKVRHPRPAVIGPDGRNGSNYSSDHDGIYHTTIPADQTMGESVSTPLFDPREVSA